MAHASNVTRIAQQVGGPVGVALIAVILARSTFENAFWWTVGFTAVAVLLSLVRAGPGRPGPRHRDRRPTGRPCTGSDRGRPPVTIPPDPRYLSG